jgi:hypothetical protein
MGTGNTTVDMHIPALSAAAQAFATSDA